MKQIFTLFMVGFIVLGMVFSFPMILAHHDSDDDSGNKGDEKKSLRALSSPDDDDEEDDEDDDERESAVEVRQEFINEDGDRVRIRTKTITRNGDEFTEYKIIIKGIEVNSKFEIKEVTRGNETTFRVRGKGDVEEALNYLPDDIADIAREELGSDDLNITLQEGRHKNLPRVLYQIEANKNGKFLGIFKLKMKIEGQIDPETGEFLGVSKPWWAFLVTGEDDDQTDDDVELYEDLEIKVEVLDGVSEVKLVLEFNTETQNQTDILNEILAKIDLTNAEIDNLLEMEDTTEEHDSERLRLRIDEDDEVNDVDFELRIIVDSDVREDIVSDLDSRLALIDLSSLEDALLDDITPPSA